MKKYRVAHLGGGGRGLAHLVGFAENPDRFELVALCDMNEDRLAAAGERFGVAARYTDADKMLSETRPDVFCFVTQPDVRLSMVELGVKHGVAGIAFEKPMALSLQEAWKMTDLCRGAGVKAVVSHQQKYLPSFQKFKEILDAGDIGPVQSLHSKSRDTMANLGTHFMDYAIWANEGRPAKWVVGHCHGRTMLQGSHPGPDFLMGNVCFDNDVRLIYEIGYAAPSTLEGAPTWADNRLTAFGPLGYAWCETDGYWGAFTRNTGGEALTGHLGHWGENEPTLQVPYMKDYADWLDDDGKPHPCRIELAYQGYETIDAICLSALENRRIDLPLADPAAAGDIYQRMRDELPEVEPLG